MNCIADDFYVIPINLYLQWYSNNAGRPGNGALFSLSYNSSTGVVSGTCGGNASAAGNSTCSWCMRAYLYVILHGQ